MTQLTIGAEIGKLSNLIKRQIHDAPFGEDMCGMTPMQAQVIRFLRENRQDRFQKDIETAFSIRRSTATGILQLMEQHGLIRREAVAHDARLKKLTLTEKAVAMDERIGRQLACIEARLRRGIEEQDVALFLCVLKKMSQNLQA